MAQTAAFVAPAVAAAPAKPNIVTRLSAACARHSKLCLGIIVALSIALIASLVKYRGLLGFGPYGGKRSPKKNDKKDDAAAADGAGAAADAAEVQRLAAGINAA